LKNVKNGKSEKPKIGPVAAGIGAGGRFPPQSFSPLADDGGRRWRCNSGWKLLDVARLDSRWWRGVIRRENGSSELVVR
ncbi:hypothetical protein TorRG33x02_337060, partial [Trema orientale]